MFYWHWLSDLPRLTCIKGQCYKGAIKRVVVDDVDNIALCSLYVVSSVT